jgi:O-antigen polymerase
MKRKFVLCLLAFTVAVTLLNSNAFGESQMIAYFLYALSAGTLAAVVFSFNVFSRDKLVKIFSPSIICFLLLVLYVILSGAFHNSYNLIHYYWAVLAIFLLGVVAFIGVSNRKYPRNYIETNTKTVYIIVSLLALLESIIVLLQCINIFPVPSSLFLCTGTWKNPNVTAMFLGLSLYAVFELRLRLHLKVHKVTITAVLLFVSLAILLLQSRTAYLVLSIFIIFEFRLQILTFFKKSFKLNFRGISVLLCSLAAIQILISIFNYKQGSTQSRIRIWMTSASLIAKEPVKGYGFGGFEKEYNSYAADLQHPVNDHVNMAYNDFLELAVEGGLPAVFLWICFLVLLIVRCVRQRDNNFRFLTVLLSMVVIQSTNFGIQSIPVFVLFLLYTGIFTARRIESSHAILTETRHVPTAGNFFNSTLPGIAMMCVAVFCTLQMATITKAYYTKWRLMQSPFAHSIISEYDKLEKTLDEFPSYHEGYGDLLIKDKKLGSAIEHYQKALEKSHQPDLLLKMGYCYQLLRNYDLSEQYYADIIKMQPHKFLPRFYLLKLYQQKSDQPAAIAKAKEIIKMPVKVRSPQVTYIKNYAKQVLQGFHEVINLN